MHAFPKHIEKGNQGNDRLTCPKSYRIKGERSRTRATDRFPTIARWGNPIYVYYVLLCNMICTCIYGVIKSVMIRVYVWILTLDDAMAINVIYEYWYHVKHWIVDNCMIYVKVLAMKKAWNNDALERHWYMNMVTYVDVWEEYWIHEYCYMRHEV